MPPIPRFAKVSKILVWMCHGPNWHCDRLWLMRYSPLLKIEYLHADAPTSTRERMKDTADVLQLEGGEVHM